MTNRILSITIALVLFPALVMGSLILTLDTTAIDTALGYTTDEAVSLVITVNPEFANNSSSQFGNGSASWIEETTSEDQLYLQLASDSFNGEFSRPMASASDPYSKLEVWWAEDFSRAIEIRIAADESDIGIRTPSDAPVTTLLVRLSDVTDFPAIDSYVSPGEYLNQLLGTYLGMSGTVEVRSGGTSAYLRVTSLTIEDGSAPAFDLSGWTWNDYYPWVFNEDHGWLYFLPTNDGLWIQKASTGQWILKES